MKIADTNFEITDKQFLCALDFSNPTDLQRYEIQSYMWHTGWIVFE